MSVVAIPTLIQGGFVWMATQAWADLGKKTINKVWPGDREGIIATAIYCVALTIAIFLIIWLIHRAAAIDYKARYNALLLRVASQPVTSQRGQTPLESPNDHVYDPAYDS